ncbi:MAG: sulfurtransferase TusA family protein [Deferribacteraceae bacterium]|jgi:sulfite reductase (ferredoxin)|nr:sulfurtransferase TusA family protein [Deferribacteraceae bacterium]
MSSYELPSSIADDLEKFKEVYKDYLAGKVDNMLFKAARVPFGIYEQRERGSFMIRTKLPGGIISLEQLKRLAELAERFGDGRLHITTRAGAQIHGVKIGDFIEAIELLHAVGLTNRGGGGNTVRNITAKPLSGVAKGEAFDITPHLLALNLKMLERKDSYNLPRKYKIAFTADGEDSLNAEATDIGFAAKVRSGVRGFKVFVCGGMGGKSKIGLPLIEFLPEDEVFLLAQAVKEVFNEYGNRRDKSAARLRFLLEQIGFEKFRCITYFKCYELKGSLDWRLNLKELPELPSILSETCSQPLNVDEALWRQRFVIPQKQEGYFAVKVPLYLGDASSESLKELVNALAHKSVECIRFGADQNIYLRNLVEEELTALHPLLKRVSPLVDKPALIGDISVCAGALTCQLGITNSRGAFRAIEKKLANLPLDELSGLKIKISGCPNSCGRHLTADIGFYGKVKREGGVSYPAYAVVAGAAVKDGRAKFAENIGDISAFFLADFVAEALLTWKAAKADFKDFTAYFYDKGAHGLKEILARYANIPPFEEDKNPYYDLYVNEIFSLKGRGAGECSAGMTDLLEADKTALEKVLQEEPSPSKLSLIRLYATRMLLVARGEDARDALEAAKLFKLHFIDTGLISAKFTPLLEGEPQEGVVQLAEAVLRLYSTMDNTLKFTGELSEGAVKAVKLVDLRGVACPLNFVKTKIELAKVRSGDAIEVLLDDGAPIENVPRSAASEGHTVSEPIDEGGYWRVRIEKK